MTKDDSKKVQITYCRQCKWLLRSAWMAQELLSTFEQELSEVSLVPGEGGIFEIRSGDTLLWSRERDGGFPDVKNLKKVVRDHLSPNKDLGHIDK